jgi:hypothetical protein
MLDSLRSGDRSIMGTSLDGSDRAVASPAGIQDLLTHRVHAVDARWGWRLSLVSWKLRCWLPPGVSRRIATPGFNRTGGGNFPGNTQELFRKGGVRCDSVGIRLAGRPGAGVAVGQHRHHVLVGVRVGMR